MNKIYCKCGCGLLINKLNKWGNERMYKNGHQFRGKHLSAKSRKRLLMVYINKSDAFKNKFKMTN